MDPEGVQYGRLLITPIPVRQSLSLNGILSGHLLFSTLPCIPFFFFTSAKPKTRQAETGPLFPYLQMISASVMIILKVSLGVDWSKGQLWLYNMVLNSLSKYTFICGKLVCTWLPLHLCTCLWNVFKNVGSLACQSCLADWSSIWSPTFGFIWCLRHNQSQSLVLLGPPWSGGQSSTWIHHLPGHGDLMGLWLCWWCYSCHQALT